MRSNSSTALRAPSPSPIRIDASATIAAALLVLAASASSACKKGGTEAETDPTETTDPTEKPTPVQQIDLHGDPLPAGAYARFGSLRMLDSDLVQLQFAPGGRELVSSSAEAYVLWDAATGKELRRLALPDAGPVLAISPDGARMATSVVGGNIQLWDFAKRSTGDVLSGHKREITGACFIDADTLVTSSEDQTVRVWNLAQPAAEAQVAELEGEWDEVTALDCSPAVRAMVWGDQKGQVYIAELSVALEGGAATALVSRNKRVNAVAYSSTGSEVAIATDDGRVLLFIPGRRKPLELDAHERRALSVAFDGKGTLYSSGADDKIKLWDGKTGAFQSERAGAADHESQLIVLSPDGKTMATYTERVEGRASEAGRFWLWDTATGDAKEEPVRHAGAVNQIVFTKDGKSVATAGHDGAVHVWEVPSGRHLRQVTKQAGAINDLQLGDDGAALYSAGRDARLVRANVGGGGETRLLEPVGGEIKTFALSNDGRRVLTGDYTGKVWLWDRGNGQKLSGYDEGKFDAIFAVAYARKDRQFVIAGSSRDMWVVGTASGKRIAQLSPDGVVSNHAIAFSADRKLMVSGGDDHVVRIWNAGNWKQKHALKGHDGTVRAVAFSADGKYVASGASDGWAKVWDVETGSAIASFEGHTGAVTGVSFSPKSSWLATSSQDKTALLWKLAGLEGVDAPEPTLPGKPDNKPGKPDNKPGKPDNKPDNKAGKPDNKPDNKAGKPDNKPDNKADKPDKKQDNKADKPDNKADKPDDEGELELDD